MACGSSQVLSSLNLHPRLRDRLSLIDVHVLEQLIVSGDTVLSSLENYLL